MLNKVPAKRLRTRRSFAVVIAILTLVVFQTVSSFKEASKSNLSQTAVLAESNSNGEKASELLDRLVVKGRAAKTGYKRAEFGDGWGQVGNCDVRNIMLKRYLAEVVVAENNCIVLSGTLQDLYTGKTIRFVRGSTTSDDVQIDHVVALSDSWQKGAQGLSFEQRVQFANDPLNLIPVDGSANQQKGDSDAASWLPPNKSFRCQYVARQIAVKSKYRLWITEAEKAAMQRVLSGCGEQVVPVESTP